MLYMLEFSGKLGGEKHSAQYYLGFVESDVEARLAEHRAGRGAAITRAAVERGYELRLVGVIEGTRADERRLKNRKNHKRLLKLFIDCTNQGG